MAKALMIQGTGSDVGKSLLVAGLCRVLARRGLRVLPFKPQNMSNHAAVSDCGGGEIGRAQWLQARACGLATSVHMNPVLLKPEGDGLSQVVLHGRAIGRADASYYRTHKQGLLAKVHTSFAQLRAQADIVIVEGAGSPAEINLREGDIANMGFAQPLDIPVVLVGDIERGGVIASTVGTHAVLSEADRACITGFIINKFRGDVALFDAGVKAIMQHTGWAHRGTLPYISGLRHLPAEDGFSLARHPHKPAAAIRIAVLRLPHLANAADLDPLAAEPDVEVRFVQAGEALPMAADIIIIPGTKSSSADLAFIRAQGWDAALYAYVQRGGRVLGLCGGYQILGKTLSDPQGFDGAAGDYDGLGLLDVHTHYVAEKMLLPWQGCCAHSGLPVRGFHMRMGRSDGPDCAYPVLEGDGASAYDGRVQGVYLHGLFVEDDYRHYFLNSIKPRKASGLCYRQLLEEALDGLADALEEYCDVDGMVAGLSSDY